MSRFVVFLEDTNGNKYYIYSVEASSEFESINKVIDSANQNNSQFLLLESVGGQEHFMVSFKHIVRIWAEPLT